MVEGFDLRKVKELGKVDYLLSPKLFQQLCVSGGGAGWLMENVCGLVTSKEITLIHSTVFNSAFFFFLEQLK